MSCINVRQLISVIDGFNASTKAQNEGESTSDNSKLLDTITLRVNLRMLSPILELYFLKKPGVSGCCGFFNRRSLIRDLGIPL